MLTDAGTETRKVDKRTAMAKWDNTVLPPAVRKKRPELEEQGDEREDGSDVMNFTLITKRGNKQQVKTISLCANKHC
jgi:regulator of nonsense transcripts 2